MIAFASGHTEAAESLLAKVNELILFPLMSLLVAVAMLVFLWGAFEFVRNVTDGDRREEARRHMFWGIIGLLVILSAYTILQIAAGTFGISV